jgi:hypothetical protein
MRVPAKYVAWLLPLALTGCFHKQQTQTQPLAPPLAEPAPQPAQPTDTANLPPPVITVPAEPKPATTAANTPPPPPPKPRVRHKKPATKDVEEASNGTPGVSAAGQLSSGDPPDLRRQTEDSIASTERGLSGITHPLSDQDQRTVEHIREFLKQAKQALAAGDIDGASTLAAKARVLFAEVTR